MFFSGTVQLIDSTTYLQIKMVKISVASYLRTTGVRTSYQEVLTLLLPGAMVFCLQFQFLGLELCGQPVPLMAGNKNDLSWGTESCNTQAVTKPRVADERGH